MSKGFATEASPQQKKKFLTVSNKPKGRLISWSPWPPADFQTRYPAFRFICFNDTDNSIFEMVFFTF